MTGCSSLCDEFRTSTDRLVWGWNGSWDSEYCKVGTSHSRCKSIMSYLCCPTPDGSRRLHKCLVLFQMICEVGTASLQGISHSQPRRTLT
eukprot:930125-Pleurochrysis_carterae.AAC.2